MIKSLIPRNWPFFLILGLLLAVWLLVGQASAYQYTDDDGTIIVKPDTARYAYVVGDTPAIVADRLYSLSGTADEFVRMVHLYIVRNIKYVSDGSWSVKSPERTLIDLAGDCSEMALPDVPYDPNRFVPVPAEGWGTHASENLYESDYLSTQEMRAQDTSV